MKRLLLILVWTWYNAGIAQNSYYGSLGVSLVGDRPQFTETGSSISEASFKWFGFSGSFDFQTADKNGFSFEISTRTFGRSFAIAGPFGKLERSKYGFQIGVGRVSVYHAFDLLSDKLHLEPRVGIAYANIIGDKGRDMSGKLSTANDSVRYWTETNYITRQYFLFCGGLSADYSIAKRIRIGLFYNWNAGLKNVYVMKIYAAQNNDPLKSNTQTYNGTYSEFGCKLKYKLSS
ncbi:MAG TPA: hypothetical protein VGF30_14115 [Bacteroidia bacterium]